MKPLIKIDNLTVAYDGKTVLQEVCLTVEQNDFLGVIGPNGGGKTTLVKAILGLVPHVSGTIEYFSPAGQPADCLNIGYLPQYLSFDFSFPVTVSEVIASGLLTGRSLFHRFTAAERARAVEVMDLFGLKSLAGHSVGRLSGGQRQRVLMARAMVSGPQLLVLDEPSTYMDKDSEGMMYDLLRDINSRCAIMLVSHDVGTIVREVRNIACVNRTLHYHPSAEPADEWFGREVGCPFEMVAHGRVPHRILSAHSPSARNDNRKLSPGHDA